MARILAAIASAILTGLIVLAFIVIVVFRIRPPEGWTEDWG